MPQANSYDMDVMVFKTGGGCLTLVGLPFLAVGLFTLFAPYFLPPPTGADFYIVVGMGSVFALIGAVILFARSKTVIDRKMGFVHKTDSVIVPLRSKQYALTDYDTVFLSKEVRRSKNSTYYVYPVKLTGPGGEIKIEESQRYEDQRRIAENIAKFTGFNVADSSSGQTVVREARNLDESLREKVRRTGQISEIPPMPTPTKIACTTEGQEFQVALPPNPLGKLLVVAGPVLVALIWGSLFVEMGQLWKHDVLSLKIMIGAVVCLPCLIILFYFFKAGTRRCEVRVSPERLALIEAWMLGKKIREIPTAELEELVVVSPTPDLKGLEGLSWLLSQNHIVARSDRRTLCIGKGLSPAELAWIHAVIEHTTTV